MLPVGKREARRGEAIALLIASAIALCLWLKAPLAQDRSPAIVVAEYDGIVHPIAAEFFDDVVTHADAAGATATVLVLRTPGGLVDSTRAIVTRMISSRAPIVVFIAPSGARAASAGFLITLAADVAVMAPGTHIGAAHPVPASGETPGRDVTARKSAEDTAAYARAIADARGRNSSLAAAAVIDSRAFTEREALTAAPPLIDFVAADLDDVVRQLDGRTVRRFDGRTVELTTRGARVDRVEMSRRQTILGLLAHPQIAYLLLTFGMLGLVVEFWNPGLIAPGAAGAVCLLLAFFAFQVLPVNLTGVLLVVLGVALLGAEVMSPSFGALGIAGIVALLSGSLLITRELPGITVSYAVILPVVAVVAAGVLGLGRLALHAQRQRSVGGAEALIGKIGVALTPIGSGVVGQIRIHGEIWRAISTRDVAAHQQVIVTAIEGLTLQVQPANIGPFPGGAS
jgi:membrane-bound serine protease (ClpP class)